MLTNEKSELVKILKNLGINKKMLQENPEQFASIIDEITEELIKPSPDDDIYENGPPVPMEEWLESNYHMGNSTKTMYPLVKDHLIEVFGHVNFDGILLSAFYQTNLTELNLGFLDALFHIMQKKKRQELLKLTMREVESFMRDENLLYGTMPIVVALSAVY